ncbi:MAG: hypothetical protein KIT00_12270 [Rhodospirillales bacterium]|nr:hypothetical protein [Rhodospirillales bacterium]
MLDAIIATIAKVATPVDPSHIPFRLADADDEIYLATAVAGGAQALVTGNIRHFPDKIYGMVAVLTPREFLERAL